MMRVEVPVSALFTMGEAARQLGGISSWTLRKHVTRGTLAVTRIGRRVLVSAQEIERVRQQGLPSLVTPVARNSEEKTR